MPHIRWVVLPLGLLLLQGCSFPFHSDIDREILERTAAVESLGRPPEIPASTRAPDVAARGVADDREPVVRAVQQEKEDPLPPWREKAPDEGEPKIKRKSPLKVPQELPGATAPAIALPREKAAKQNYLRDLYPPTPVLPPEQPPAPGPEGRPLTLADLQRLGDIYSPAIKYAMAAVEAARGAARQAGAYPNPSFFFEQDTVQTFQAGYQGGGVDQVIKTGGKLKVQEAAAIMDVLNAEVALRRARADMRYNVRGYYFAVLVARENIKVSDALFRFVEAIYRNQVRLVQVGGFAAAYEPMQLRPLVLQAQFNLLQARNQYQASWKQLAAAMGLPCMPPTQLAGTVDMPLPLFDFCAVKGWMLQNHTDVVTAQNSVQRARYALRLAKLVPLPDIDVHALFQKDYTTPPFRVVHSLSVTVPVPIWDQNRGGIHQAEYLLAQAVAQVPQSQNALLITLADAFNRYQTARFNVDIALRQVRDQVRAFRGVYNRREQDPTAVSFGDVVTAQQALATYISGYVTALGLQWQAVVDVANLIQAEDLYQAARQEPIEPVPDLKTFESPGCGGPVVAPLPEALPAVPVPRPAAGGR